MITVPSTIYEQIGGSRFSVMTGAHSFTGDGDSLIFRIPRTNPKHITGVKITLTPTDTYTMEFYAFKGSLQSGNYRVESVAKYDDVYCDQLQDVFAEETGMAVTL